MIGKLVGLFKSAFILGKMLMDSAVMAGEIITTLQRKGTGGFMWKVVFAKVYDFLDCDFLWASITRSVFPRE